MTSTTGRGVGVLGTLARIVVGGALLGTVLYGHAVRGWHPLAWLLDLVVFPAVVLAGMWWRARRRPESLRAVGPLAHAASLAIFLALYLTWWYAPALRVLSDASLLFYGGSMLLAAARGYADCEVFAVSNWLLRRDDQAGCGLFWPVNVVDARHAGAAGRGRCGGLDAR